MPENQTPRSEMQHYDSEEINLLDLLIVLAKHKKMIMVITFGAALLALGFALLMPNVYTAKAKVLPPQSNQSSSVNAIMMAQLGGLAGAAGSALGLKDPNALYVAMLKSRRIAESIARHFELQKVYDKKTLSDTLETLEKVSSIAGGKDGVITVEVDDENPQMAADLANAYNEELNILIKTLALTEASQRRQFFEAQMKPAKDKLTDAEIALDRTPSTSLHYMGALRNLKYQEAIYEILAKQFAMAKMDEAKDSPLIQVLDKAVAPEKKSKPKRSTVVILATLAAFFFAVIWAFIKEALLRSNDDYKQVARLNKLRELLRWRRR